MNILYDVIYKLLGSPKSVLIIVYGLKPICKKCIMYVYLALFSYFHLPPIKCPLFLMTKTDDFKKIFI